MKHADVHVKLGQFVLGGRENNEPGTLDQQVQEVLDKPTVKAFVSKVQERLGETYFKGTPYMSTIPKFD